MWDAAAILRLTLADAVTVLMFDRESGVAHRLWSSLPEVFPASGQKTLMGAAWEFPFNHTGPALISRGPDDLRANFSDHMAILAQGIMMIINLPLIVDNRCIGSINCLYRSQSIKVDSDALIPSASQWFLDARRSV